MDYSWRMTTEPERPLEPKEPRTWALCMICGGDIHEGDECHRLHGEYICCECAESIWYSREIAGEDED